VISRSVRSAVNTGSLPPGPSLPAVVQAVAYHRDPLGVLRRARARYGPVFTLRFPYKAPVAFVVDPGAVDMLLHADPDRADAGSARRSVLPQASVSSPFGGDASAHQLIRAQMWPGFSPERIAAIEPGIAELATTHAARWPTLRAFRLLEAMRSLCTEVAVRLLLGISDPKRSLMLIDAIRRLLNAPGNPPLPLPGGDDGRAGAAGWAGDAMFARRAAPVRELLREELHERRLAGGPDEDVLGAMLGSPEFSDEAIIDQLLIVLMAAQEPPAIALTNIICELARVPLVAEQFRADPSARRAIIAEVLRLRPSASAMLRQLTEPVQLAGHALPAGAVIACPSPLLHREPSAFPDPDAFEPSRFANGTPAGAPYFPFGGGVRRCLGEALAEAEFRAVLPALLEHRRFRLAWPRAERMVIRATVLVPHRGALVRAIPIG
jgi:cytochrome P450 family 135